jgi:cytochrome P450
VGDERTTLEFDQYSAEYAADPHRIARRLAEEHPVFWSDANGGAWVVAGFTELAAAAAKPAIFSSRHDLPHGSTPFQGMVTPPAPMRYFPMEADIQEHRYWRQVLRKYFSIEAAEALRPFIQRLTDDMLDAVIETGEIDFVHELAGAVPTGVILEMMGLPSDNWHMYADAVHKANGSVAEEKVAAFENWDKVTSPLIETVLERRAKPSGRGDLLDCLATMKPGGRLLTELEIHGTISPLLFGGIDTTSSTVVGGLKYLHGNRQARTSLIADRSLVPGAFEEFVRYVTPQTTISRTAAEDVELGGQSIKAGDRVVFLLSAANMDERTFTCPMDVDVTRHPNKHLAFGWGSHLCIGAPLARVEGVTMLNAVFDRLPDYEIVPGAVRYPSIGLGNNYLSLRATFTPGSKVGQ